MTAPNYTTTITVNQSPEEVFRAINDVRGWWSQEIEGDTDRAGAVWNYHYQDVHRCQVRITEMIPNKRVTWEVLDNHFSFTQDKEEWKGNRMVFDITEQDGKTQLRFTQEGLVPAYECYDICENAWNTYIHKSLYNLITTGTGQPNGKEQPQTENEAALGSGNFTTSFFVEQSPQEVYDAINQVADWWQGEVKGNSQQPGDEFQYRMEDHHFSRQQVTELEPGKKIVWKVTDSRLNAFEDKTEWTGTTILFDIREINNKTQVRFTHVGLVPSLQCYGDCSGAWEQLIQKSLVSLIRTGQGVKVF